MATIKVTGTVNTEDLDDEWLDPQHSTGLSEDGFTHMGMEYIAFLSDLQFEAQND